MDHPARNIRSEPKSPPSLGRNPSPLLDVHTTPVLPGQFDTPLSDRHVLCLHLGNPVPVLYRANRHERAETRLHGQFCVTPAGQATHWIVSQPATSLLLRLTPSLLQDTADAMSLGSGSIELALSIHIRDPQIERIGWMMQAEDHDAYPGGRLFTDSLASALAARLLALQWRRGASGAAGTSGTSGRALPKWRLRHVLEYIEAHLDEDLTLTDLATVAGFSLSHFKPLFKRAVGMPVHRFVLERRVERARVLLLEGRKSLTDIALETGFAHASHMARCMRRVLGVSPTQIANGVDPNQPVDGLAVLTAN